MKSLGIAGALMLAVPLALGAQERHAPHHPAPNAARDSARTDIPKSIQQEHQEIHALLETAMKRGDAVGAAARELAQVLHPHFVREEQIALKPLGALPGAARGRVPVDACGLVAMADSLERELPRMLDEHKVIAAAVSKLQSAATAAGAQDLVRFAQQLKHHALAEEEVYYPAAVLVGRQLRHGGHQCAPHRAP